MTVIGEIRDALVEGQEIFALTRKEYQNVYQWARREKAKGKNAGIIGCYGGEYLIWHEDFHPSNKNLQGVKDE